MDDGPKEPDYSLAWKAMLLILAVIILSAYLDAHPALKAALGRGK